MGRFPTPIAIVLAVASPMQAGRSAEADGDLAEVLARAGEYALRFEASVPAIVADEKYIQRYFTPHESRPTQTRVLQSEVLIVRLPLDVRWLMYRDVHSVDGRLVTDQNGRLERILRNSPSNAIRRTQALMHESSRFKIGPVERNFNIPTLPLVFLLPTNQGRVRFEWGGRERVDGRTWAVVKGTESARPTLIRAHGLDTPVTLTYWIDAFSGAVSQSDMRFTAPHSKSRVRLITSFMWTNRTDVWLPSEMTERYDLRASAETLDSRYYIEGLATYRNVRRFEVTTEEEIGVQ